MSDNVTGVARDTIGALKSSPILLLILCLNVLMIGSMLYVGSVARDERALLTQHIIENCHK